MLQQSSDRSGQGNAEGGDQNICQSSAADCTSGVFNGQPIPFSKHVSRSLESIGKSRSLLKNLKYLISGHFVSVSIV